MNKKICNIAIIAHVDHGKTTLVDAMLTQSGTFAQHEAVKERVMDKNQLEMERGITILAKCTSIIRGDTKINIIDTPGHADFGGEVERILSCVDGVILLVDAAEGPLPQTKFVLSKALSLGLEPIVLVNKIDRQDARPDEVLNEIFDLFCSLDANEKQLDFPTLYASGRDGWAVNELTDQRSNLDPLFNKILSHVPKPKIQEKSEFSMLATLLDYHEFLGRVLTGKVYSGAIKANEMIKAMDLNGDTVEKFRVTKLFSFKGPEMIPVEEAQAGDIIAIAGMQNATVSNTLCHVDVAEPIPSTPIDPPTISICVGVNDSPLTGLEGSKVTGPMIKERLYRESESNVAIKVAPSETGESFIVSGRGELQLGVLIETMRREGFELSISRPQVIYQKGENSKKLEPIEEVVIDVDEEHSNAVMFEMNTRKGAMVDMKQGDGNKVRMTYHIPSRCLIGYHGTFLTQTRGTGVMNRLFLKYDAYRGDMDNSRNGVIISNGDGKLVGYALFNLQDRGIMFVSHGDTAYEGMIIGEHNRDNDLVVNALKGKKLTNMRASGSDESIILQPPKIMTLEQMMSYIADDELVEVTPKSLRLRKKYLKESDRKKSKR